MAVRRRGGRQGVSPCGGIREAQGRSVGDEHRGSETQTEGSGTRDANIGELQGRGLQDRGRSQIGHASQQTRHPGAGDDQVGVDSRSSILDRRVDRKDSRSIMMDENRTAGGAGLDASQVGKVGANRKSTGTGDEDTAARRAEGQVKPRQAQRGVGGRDRRNLERTQSRRAGKSLVSGEQVIDRGDAAGER